MMARIRSFTFLFSTRNVLRSSVAELEVARALRAVSLVPAGDRFLDRARLERERDRLPVEQLAQLVVAHFVDADLLLALEPAHLADALAAILLDDLVLDAREDLHVDDDAFHSRRNLERRVLHVLRLLTEDRGEELLFGRKLRLALRRDLADEDVARLHVRADAHDAALVEVDAALSSATFGISRVISSWPRLVSRTCSSSSWMWIDE